MHKSKAIKASATTLLSIVLIALAAGAQTPFNPGITLRESTTSNEMMDQNATNVTTINYLTGNAIKHSSSNGTDTIIRLDEGKIISVDNNEKTYSEITFQELNTLMGKLSETLGKNEEQMETMRKIMGQPLAISVTEQGPGEAIAGHATVKYLVTGPMQMELWVAPELKTPPAYYDALKLQMPPNPLFDMGKIYDEMKKISGITLKSITTIRMMNFEIKTSTVVTSVEEGPIPTSTFDIPAGYKPVVVKIQ